jgi:hypothetical protein
MRKIRHLKKGHVYGLLTVVGFSHVNKKNVHFYKFRCECGKLKAIAKGNVVHGGTRSCGCLRGKNRIIQPPSKKKTLFGRFVQWLSGVVTR